MRESCPLRLALRIGYAAKNLIFGAQGTAFLDAPLQSHHRELEHATEPAKAFIKLFCKI